eukprot:CAMPEP_0183383728 /NCGR_PEP_ID=MMETSP0164_2-20130417/127596_1 /TAXON_ID=221442 /ORGANISM="Coccolithus pelagicus ssp braarudi, Strain PLY182g" /LENGTH=72 /DNA_ID=CAMNT_0025561363 /DNA_START=952 /DNA_END=1167 /DNA_ORIENTATION=+
MCSIAGIIVLMSLAPTSRAQPTKYTCADVRVFPASTLPCSSASESRLIAATACERLRPERDFGERIRPERPA